MWQKKSFWLITLLIPFVALCLACSLQRSSLKIEAQIIYNMGGPQPVARQNFYLLDVDPMTLTTDDPKYKAKFEKASPEEQKALKSAAELFDSMKNLFAVLLKNQAAGQDMVGKPPREVLAGVELSKPFWDAHLVQTAQTDFKGHATLENLSPGTYWILGMTETRAAFTFWNVKVTVNAGENKLLLDQNNALYSK